MFPTAIDRLIDEVRDLRVPADADAVAGLVVLRDAVDAKLAGAVGEADAAESWRDDGAVSMQAWLRTRFGRTAREAHRMATTARRLRHLPATAAAWADGTLSGGQVDVIIANVGRHAERFAADEAAILELVAPLDTHGTAVAMRGWRAMADAEDEGPAPDEHDGTVHLSDGLDGTGVLHGTLEPEAHQVVKAALRVGDCGDRSMTVPQRRAQALTDVCRFFLDNQQGSRGGRHRPHVNVVLRYEDLMAELEGATDADGPPVAARTVGQLLCDGNLHRVLVDAAGTILDYGRATKAVPVNLFNALVVRDRGCRFPGCDRPAAWTDAHHVRFWWTGGPTSLDNLVLLCRRHHRLFHAGTGWEAKLLPDGTFEVTRPDGTTDRGPPPGSSPLPFR
jgi:hypothetical protein